MQSLLQWLGGNITSLFTLFGGVASIILAHWFWLKRQPDLGAEKKLPRQIAVFALTIVVILVIIVALPISDATRGQILSLVGIVITAMIALSSTTFVANAMAGLMLRLVDTFRPGDYLRFNEQLCRVTERGLFHTEVQNEDKDLITYPNLILVTNPVTVISHTGTLITCTVSLGYDVSREKIESHLIKAAESIGLETPFVLIKSLGDFSVNYKVSGFLTEVKSLVTWRSNLHKAILDHLHGAGIEIVSPNFMNARQLEPNKAVIPQKVKVKLLDDNESLAVEEKIFDKAEVASDKEILSDKQQQLIAEINLATEKNDANKLAQLESELSELNQLVANMSAEIEQK